MEITSEPAGALAKIDPGGIELTTPGFAELQRKESYTVRFDLPGYETTKGYLDKETSGLIYLNFLLGGIIGLSIDQSTGAAYDLVPDPLHVQLVPHGENEAEPSEEVSSTPSAEEPDTGEEPVH